MKNKPAVLLTLESKLCDRIISAEQTAVIKRRRPIINTPFKCYIFQKASEDGVSENDGKVIAEFMCNDITALGNVSYDAWDRLHEPVQRMHMSIVEDAACMTEAELQDTGGKFVLHIDDLKVYEVPKEISDFNKYHLRTASETPLTVHPIAWCYVAMRSTTNEVAT